MQTWKSMEPREPYIYIYIHIERDRHFRIGRLGSLRCPNWAPKREAWKFSKRTKNREPVTIGSL